MNQLLPIIRRVRRPLLVQDAPPVMVGSVEPVQVNAECETRNAELGNIEHPTTNIQPPMVEKLVNEVSGETVAAPRASETTGETPVPPKDKRNETPPPKRKAR